ncbi:MAG: hypothetical protein AB7S26_34570 [Sandaracinaceae bacterium]
MSSLGYGWHLVAFDPVDRRGTVALGDRRLDFDAAAATGEDLRIGDDVFVRLQSSDAAPHVARVWPTVARVRVSDGRVLAPALDDAIGAHAAGVLGHALGATPVQVVDEGRGSVLLVVCEIDANAYGIGGADITVYGAVRCGGARAMNETRLDAADVRLALPEERAIAHADEPLTPRSIVVAIPERRSADDSAAPARVAMVVCASVAWIAPPDPARAREAEAALLQRAPFTRGVAAVEVEAGSLIARGAEDNEPFFDLASPAEATAFVPVCAAWTAALRGDDEES